MSGPCDVDDILCQLNLLNSLKSLKSTIGNEGFQQEYPELIGLDQKIQVKIETQEMSLRETISRCGQIEESEVYEFDQDEEEE